MATAVYDNTIEAWTLLAMLPKCVIPAPRRGGDKGKASHASIVRKCLTRWKNKEYQSLWNEASASMKRKHKSTPQIQSIEEEDRKAALRAVRLVRDGELSRAMTALTSEPLAPNDDTTFHKLQAKHPSRLLDPSPIATLPSDIKPLTATAEDMMMMMMMGAPIWPLQAVGPLPSTLGWPDGSDISPMRTTGPCGPAVEPAVASHGWHFT